jgi:metal-sulfur cluster biosynthetic enzyme
MALPSAEDIRAVIKDNVVDPEVGFNIVDLGLVYDVHVADSGQVKSAEVTMTLTSPACPLGPQMISQIQQSIQLAYPELDQINVHLVWHPMWNPDMMTSEAKDALGFY